MKKRIAAMLLAVSLLLTVPALAATDSTSNFTRSKTYSGEFSDLSERYFMTTWWPCMSMDCLWARPTEPSVFRTP